MAESLDAAVGGAAPDVVGTAVGWRTWNVRNRVPVLHSPIRDTTWPAGEPLRAMCHRGHTAPTSGCTCGLYAVRDVWAAIAAGGRVLGCVALWGEVVEGEHGWRAETGYPSLLVAGPDVPAATRRKLAARYGVPVLAVGTTLAQLSAGAGAVRPGRQAFAAAAESVRFVRARRPDIGPGTPEYDGPVGRLIERMRPGAVPVGLGPMWLALVLVCLLPAGWAALVAAAVALVGPDLGTNDPTRNGWRALVALVALPGLLWMAWTVGTGLLVGAGTLLGALGSSLGRAGRLLARAVVVPGALGVAALVIAVWELLGHRDPGWLPWLLTLPVLVTVLGLTVRAATRPRLRRAAPERWASVGVLVTLVVVVTGALLASPRIPDLGRDIAYVGQSRTYWAARIADDAPPGLCLGSAEAFYGAGQGAVVECGGPHWGEVAGYAPIGPLSSSDEDQARAAASFACRRLETAQGLAARPELADTFLFSTSGHDDAGRTQDDYATCAVYRRDGTPLPPGRHVDPTRRGPDLPVVMDLYGDRPRRSAPVGACVADRHAAESDIHDAPVVTCDRPHWAEILGYPVVAPPGSPWPGDAAVQALAVTACTGMVTARGLPAETAADRWPAGDFWVAMASTGPRVVCLARRPDDAPVTGPMH